MREYSKKDDMILVVSDTTEKIETVSSEINIHGTRLMQWSILQLRNDQVEARQAEIDAVQTLLSEADRLGISGDMGDATKYLLAQIDQELARWKDLIAKAAEPIKEG